MNILKILVWGLRLAGAGQLFIAIQYQWTRRIIGWDADMGKLRRHNRCIAQTYARYIQGLNTAFGLVCLLQPRELLGQSPLAADVTLLIGVYWLARLILQFAYYNFREITAKSRLYQFGEYAFAMLFAFQAAALLVAFAYDMHWLMP
jgi:hypothetical protein